MRPYLAIIIDSFRAALASRVLYIMLALITLLFLIVGPLHLTETLDWRLNQFQHFENTEAIVSRLIERGESGKSKTTTRVWNLLSKETQATVRKLYEDDGKETQATVRNGDEYGGKSTNDRRGPGGRRRPPDLTKLVDELNAMIQNPTFYRAEDWDRFSIVSEAKSILEDGVENLGTERMRRLNRLLMGKALPGLAPADSAAISVYYWFSNWDGQWVFSASQQQVANVASSVATFWFDKLLLSAGLLVGIVVTANVVPQMFEPGTLNLLLSKPISRSGLYLTRFIGGCSQVAICATYLFTGTWLWFGVAIGVWNIAFLWSIPIYILVFAMYYSVSALVGLLFRSPILSVVATVVFWATCFSVGVSHTSAFAFKQNQRLYDPLVTENGAVAVDGYGDIVAWDASSNAWTVAAKNSDFKDQMAVVRWTGKLKLLPNQIRPTIDSVSQQVVTGVTMPLPPQPTGFDRYKGYSGDSQSRQFNSIGNFPSNTMAMFSTDQGMLFCDHNGKFTRWDAPRPDLQTHRRWIRSRSRGRCRR